MNLEQLPSRSWRVTVRHRGQRRRATARTQAQARMLGAELMLDLGATPPAGNITVAQLLDVHILENGYTPHAEQDLRSLVKKVRETRPKLAIYTMRVRDVEPVTINHLYRTLDKHPDWSEHRITKLHMLLSSAFGRAKRYNWARDNPTSGLAPEVPKLPDIDPPGAEEVKRILSAAEDVTVRRRLAGKFALLVRVSASIGSRVGETCAIKWIDLDLPKTGAGFIHVRRALIEVAGKGLIVKEVKTGEKGNRKVTIGPKLVEALREHRVTQREVAMSAGLGAPEWVFSNDAGRSPWRPNWAGQRYRAMVDAMEPPVDTTIHQLRHYVATNLLMKGEPIAIVAGILGDSQRTIERRYAHWTPGSDASAAATMEELLG